MKPLFILTILTVLKVTILFSPPSFAVIPDEQTVLDINAITAMALQEELTTEDIAKYIPVNMGPTDSSTDVGKRIVKQTTRTLLKSELIKNSSLGKTAESIKEGVNTEIKSAQVNEEQEEIHHKVKFKLDPLKTEAKVTYTGFFNAQSVYELDENSLKIEIKERIFEEYDFVISHDVNEKTSLMQLRWSWNPQ